jgi:hypothetical protein
VFVRLVGAIGLLLVGAYLFAEALSNLILLPVALELAALTGQQAVSQVATWQSEFIVQLMFGVICLAGSAFVAFFKPQAFRAITQISANPPITIPQLSQTSNFTTEQLITELKSRMPRN